MTTGERRPHKSRKAWNLWIIAAFALMPVALAVGLWGIATHGGGAGRLVFSTVASVLVLVGILCFRRGQTRKLPAGRTSAGVNTPSAARSG
jgi:hypothetical protein